MANPITLAHLGARLTVKVKMPFGRNLLQSLLRTATDIGKTERLLGEVRKEVPRGVVGGLLQYAELLTEEPRAVRRVEVEAVEGVHLLSPLQKTAAQQLVRLEVRRLEKQQLVDYGASPEARFLMTEFVPVLGRPLLGLFNGTGDKGDFLAQSMAVLQQLIASIESRQLQQVRQAVAQVEDVTWRLIQVLVRENAELVKVTGFFCFLLLLSSDG